MSDSVWLDFQRERFSNFCAAKQSRHILLSANFSNKKLCRWNYIIGSTQVRSLRPNKVWEPSNTVTNTFFDNIVLSIIYCVFYGYVSNSMKVLYSYCCFNFSNSLSTLRFPVPCTDGGNDHDDVYETNERRRRLFAWNRRRKRGQSGSHKELDGIETVSSLGDLHAVVFNEARMTHVSGN